MNEPELASRSRDQAVIVRQSLNEQFWNPAGRDFHFAALGNGRFADARSILSAVPMVSICSIPALPTPPSTRSVPMSSPWTGRGAGKHGAAGPARREPRGNATATAKIAGTRLRMVSPFHGVGSSRGVRQQQARIRILHSVSNLETLRYNNLGYAAESLDRSRLVPARGMPHSAASQP